MEGNSSNISALDDNTTNPPTITTAAQYRYVAAMFSLSVFPVLLVLGVIGNSLAFLVLQSKHYRCTVTGFLLSVLAVMDTTALLTGLLRRWIGYLTHLRYDVRLHSNAACAIHVFITYLSTAASAWTLVVFTVERTIAVYRPLKAASLCSLKTVAIVWAVTVAALALFYSQFLVTQRLRPQPEENVWDKGCDFAEPYKAYVPTFTKIEGAVSTVIPWLCIAVCNGMIIFKLSRSGDSVLGSSASQQQQQQRGITVTLLLVSVVFLVCDGPLCVYYALEHKFPRDTPEQDALQDLITTCVNGLYYVTNASDFLLYCLSSRRFRAAFTHVICGVSGSNLSDPGTGAGRV